MDFSNFSKEVQSKASQLEDYLNNGAITIIKRETYRFIDDNFRLQGWQGASFQPWKANKKGTTILVKSGHLRNGFNDETLPGAVRFYNNMPYAKVHNEGFSGTVSVGEHNRFKYGKVKVSDIYTRKSRQVYTKTAESKVSSHTRNMEIDQRQYAPTEESESPVLNEYITKALETDILNLFKTF